MSPEPIVLSKEYLDMARTLLHVASNMTDQTTADLLMGQLPTTVWSEL
jgi:hypothetical protein